MKRSVYFYILLLLAISIWSFGPTAREAKALTEVNLTSPGDSTKVITATPTFKWKASGPDEETPRRFHIKLALDPNFTSIVWEDSTIEGSEDSKVCTPLDEWQAYYWTMRVEVDSQTTWVVDSDTIDTTITYWQDFGPHFTFFYTTATVFHIRADGSGDLPTIQEGIVWAAAGDMVLVEPGVYEENLRFYKSNLLVTSNCCANPDSIDTTIINRTIIDGSKLTRGEEKGSVVYFASGVDSNSTLMGFTIRGGTGTKADIGGAEKINGGGIFCDEGSSPTIVYNVITGNQTEDDGGGIFINSAAPNILHNIITNNSAIKGSGGAIQCFYYIKVGASAGLSPDEQKGEDKKKASSEKSGSGAEIKESPSPSKSRLKMNEGEMKNLLNPRDATDVASATTSHLTQSTQNDPPEAVFEWHARKDTIIVRDKYLPGDTLVFIGTGSSDPDSGDSITRYNWQYYRYYNCTRDPDSDKWDSPTLTLSSKSVYTLAITEGSSKAGRLRVRLRVRDTFGLWGYSDVFTFNIQYRPHADAGDAVAVAPEDTVWLDGTESCDVNPDDTLLYTWTQLSGPVSVTLENADSAKAYFIPEDSTYLGDYEFQLKVSDSMEADSATVQVTVSRPPTAVCINDPVYGDTLVGGFTPDSMMILDASSSSDPDPGDQVKYYLWEKVTKTIPTKDGYQEVEFQTIPPQPDSTLAVQTFRLTYGSKGGLLKYRLKVKDSYGVISQNYDSVFFSVQYPPLANAGKDTLLCPETVAYLTGRAIEINPDQRNSLKYNWSWVLRPTVGFRIKPSTTVQSIYFDVPESGVYILGLIVDDGFILSDPDEVIVVANKLPDAKVVNVSNVFEGDTVKLDASASYDPDSAVFKDLEDTTAWLTFKWSVKEKPAGAQEPEIVDADQPIAKFIPYSTGTYKFEVLVNDTLSKNQPPAEDANIAVLTVTVDSTYAYPIIQGNLISHNFAGAKGGGINCNQSSPDIINNVFYKNQSKLSGGAICCRYFSTPQIRSNIFFGNISSDSTGGDIADLGAQLAPSATRGFRKNLAIQYNDFWDNRGGTLYQVSGNTSDNIYDFPRLIDPDFGDFRFECTSPCFGAGDPLHPDIGSLIYFQPCDTVKRLKMVSLSLFQNPVATAVAHFIVNTDVALKAPPVAWVTIGDHQPSPVFFVPISSGTYRGSFVFTASGIADISVFASSVVERDTIATRNFSVEFIGAGKVGKLVSYDKKMQVLFPEGSVKGEIYATCISVSEDSRYQFEEKPEVVAFGEAYQLGPSTSFEKELIISFPLLGDLDLKDKDKTLFSVYKYEDGKWNKLESFLEGNSVCAKVKSLGVYRLIYDARGKHIVGIPKTYQLFQNYPNPFNPETQIRYDLPVSGHVKLTVYNVLGQKVKVLVDEIQDAGHKSVIWDSRDEDGREVASGIYFYKIKAENYLKTKKMILLK